MAAVGTAVGWGGVEWTNAWYLDRAPVLHTEQGSPAVEGAFPESASTFSPGCCCTSSETYPGGHSAPHYPPTNLPVMQLTGKNKGVQGDLKGNILVSGLTGFRDSNAVI